MIEGNVKDKNNGLLSGVLVELKDDSFNTIISKLTDKNGYFRIENNNETYAYLTAVKEYSLNYLEYWCRNINLNNVYLNIVIDKLEIYNLQVFDNDDFLIITFRPMSLIKYQNKESNLCPDISNIEVFVDGNKTDIMNQSIIKEVVDSYTFDNIRIKITKGICWNKIDVKIYDNDDHVGMASFIK